ncbi:hypothetical protein IWQ60_001049 [Tieghemiomyces parasiticus]|uniref:Vacuolar import and degradation protein-domain-containing protein n=1 Tax=Tieghemiomyces parasiticus TaxID=78921 RepID=A0A9W8E291_9FUNG|nr:hypothetical protein IWQ60_001049 [Tieghemiomyces parasiticus]
MPRRFPSQRQSRRSHRPWAPSEQLRIRPPRRTSAADDSGPVTFQSEIEVNFPTASRARPLRSPSDDPPSDADEAWPVYAMNNSAAWLYAREMDHADVDLMDMDAAGDSLRHMMDVVAAEELAGQQGRRNGSSAAVAQAGDSHSGSDTNSSGSSSGSGYSEGSSTADDRLPTNYELGIQILNMARELAPSDSEVEANAGIDRHRGYGLSYSSSSETETDVVPPADPREFGRLDQRPLLGRSRRLPAAGPSLRATIDTLTRGGQAYSSLTRSLVAGASDSSDASSPARSPQLPTIRDNAGRPGSNLPEHLRDRMIFPSNPTITLRRGGSRHLTDPSSAPSRGSGNDSPGSEDSPTGYRFALSTHPPATQQPAPDGPVNEADRMHSRDQLRGMAPATAAYRSMIARLQAGADNLSHTTRSGTGVPALLNGRPDAVNSSVWEALYRANRRGSGNEEDTPRYRQNRHHLRTRALLAGGAHTNPARRSPFAHRHGRSLRPHQTTEDLVHKTPAGGRTEGPAQPLPVPHPTSECSFLRPGARFRGKQATDQGPPYDFGELSEWEVRVTIDRVDHARGWLAGTMQSVDVPKASSSKVTTYWDGEILDFKTRGLHTRKWHATSANDRTMWLLFRALRPLAHGHPGERLEAFTPALLREVDQDYILMRWKERFFTDCTQADNSLTIAGFYYICMRRRDGAIQGYYHDHQCRPYQHLRLKPDKAGGSGQTFPALTIA